MRALAFLCLLSVGLSLFGCHRKTPKRYSATTLDYLDTVCVIYGYEADKAAFDSIAREAFEKLAYYHKLFDIYREYEGMTNAATLNRMAGGDFLAIDKPLFDLLMLGKEMYTLTRGTVNIAMGSVLSVWHNYRSAGIDYPDIAALPTAAELSLGSAHMDISALELDEANQSARLSDPDASLDLGALAKGFAADLLIAFLREKGCTGGYAVSLGGNVATLGSKADGAPFTVGIENPLDKSDYVCRLSVKDASLVTSGSYQRYYTVSGKTYHHIIDPETLFPAERGLVSVSVLCKSSAMADALSTCLFILEPSEGLALVEGLPDTEALWLHQDGTVQKSSGLPCFIQ